jgi:serine/threonine protein kinase
MIKSISTHQIKLIDFGLSDGMRVKRASTLIGNVRFSSRDAHFGYSSRKDDLESLVFVLFYLMTGSLPWQSATKEQIEMEINRKAETNSNVDTPILQAKHDFIEKLEYPPTKN